MKRTILAFALPLLLALAPTAASAARILWISIDPEAALVDETGKELGKLNTYKFQPSTKVLNAAKVSVEGDGVAQTYLCFVYEGENGLVVNDPDSRMVEVNIPSASGENQGQEQGQEQGAGTTSDWLAAYLSDLYSDSSSGNLNVTLELGHMDWDTYVTQYNNDPSHVTVEFERMAFATKTISQLQEAGYLSEVASTAPPDQKPWSPSSFEYTAVPEPSVCATALLGVLLLAKRRKTRRASDGR